MRNQLTNRSIKGSQINISLSRRYSHQFRIPRAIPSPINLSIMLHLLYNCNLLRFIFEITLSFILFIITFIFIGKINSYFLKLALLNIS